MSLDRSHRSILRINTKVLDSQQTAMDLFTMSPSKNAQRPLNEDLLEERASPHTKNPRHAIKVRKMRDHHSDFYHVLDDLSHKIKAYKELFYLKQPKNRWEMSPSSRAKRQQAKKDAAASLAKGRNASETPSSKPRPFVLKKMHTLRSSPFHLGNKLIQGSVLST